MKSKEWRQAPRHQSNQSFHFNQLFENELSEWKVVDCGGWRMGGNEAAFSSRLLWWVKGCPQPLAPPKRRQARREESSGMSLISFAFLLSEWRWNEKEKGKWKEGGATKPTPNKRKAIPTIFDWWGWLSLFCGGLWGGAHLRERTHSNWFN